MSCKKKGKRERKMRGLVLGFWVKRKEKRRKKKQRKERKKRCIDTIYRIRYFNSIGRRGMKIRGSVGC